MQSALKPTTAKSYREVLGWYVIPHIGGTPLAVVTGLQLTKLYRDLEASGRRDGKPGGLSPRTVRYVHTILHRALKDAVMHDRLKVNPADKARPPSAKEATSPEMRTWDRDELRAFLHWSEDPKSGDDLRVAWQLLEVFTCVPSRSSTVSRVSQLPDTESQVWNLVRA